MLRLLFGLRLRVPRREYLVAGLVLAALKFGLDTAIVYGFTRHTWSPLGYLVPSIALRTNAVGSGPTAMYVLLAVTAMPFLWVGLTMSVRRAADAGLPPWLGLAFAVPILNYLTIALLSVVPSSKTPRWEEEVSPASLRGPVGPGEVAVRASVRATMLGLLTSILVGVGMLSLSVYGLKMYGAALFFATPFAMGAGSAAVYNRPHSRTLGQTVKLAVAGTALTGAVVLLFALEGLMCLVMAMPIAAALAALGAIVSWAIVNQSGGRAPASLMLVLPALAAFESKLERPPLRDVTTVIEIDAPPEKVWPNVIGFSELPAPPEWFFRLGIAYPQRARIEGSGVGAVRHCEFSTGPFVEPITVWDPPRKLAFDVTKQPPSMTEWSPYHELRAPHLEGYMVSKGGEFRLIALPNGRTRLEGTTHYTLAIYPEVYWTPYAETLLHAIHGRVLAHIRHLSEGTPR